MRWLRWGLGVVAVFFGLLLLAPLGAYLHFVRFANTELEPASPDRFPRAALELAARDCGCDALSHLLGRDESSPLETRLAPAPRDDRAN